MSSTYEDAVKAQKFMNSGNRVVKVYRLQDRYEMITANREVYHISVEEGQKLFPFAIVKTETPKKKNKRPATYLKLDTQ